MAQQRSRDGVAQLEALMRDAPPSPTIGGPPPRIPVDPERRRRRRRGGLIGSGIAVLVVVGLVAGYVGLTLNAPVGAAAAAVKRPDVVAPPAATPRVPTYGESAFDVAGATEFLGSAGIQASYGGNGAVPIASISKLITAMVVLSAKPLNASGGPTITFDKADHDLYDKYYLLNATIAAMPTNSSMSEHDAIEVMLVASACNYAEAMANWAFGSQPAFLAAAKKWMTAHGMTGTHLVEPTGIDARNTSTPSDLLTLGKLAMADPAVAAIVGMKALAVPTLPAMPNTNDILGVDGIDGIKTGTLDDYGSNLLFSANLTVSGIPEPLRVFGVILGGGNRAGVDSDVRAFFTSITSGFHDVTVASKGQSIGTYSTPWGAHATMVLGADASLFTWSDTAITSTMTTTALKTGADGEKIGSVTWKAGTRTVTVPIVLKGTIRPPTDSWRLSHPQNLLTWWPGYHAVGTDG